MELDKKYHFEANALIMVGVYVVCQFFGLGWWGLLIAFGCAVAALFGKELYDSRPGGSGFDKEDLRYDFYGQLAGLTFDVVLGLTSLL